MRRHRPTKARHLPWLEKEKGVARACRCMWRKDKGRGKEKKRDWEKPSDARNLSSPCPCRHRLTMPPAAGRRFLRSQSAEPGALDGLVLRCNLNSKIAICSNTYDIRGRSSLGQDCIARRIDDQSELVLKIAETNPHLYQRDVENIVNAILTIFQASKNQ